VTGGPGREAGDTHVADPGRRAVLFDRDGVINRMVYHAEFGLVDSPQNAGELELLPGAGEAVRRVNEMGLLALVVSNQPGIAKGKCAPAGLEATTARLHEELAAAGARLDGVYYCLHHPDAVLEAYRVVCQCRKPGPGLLWQAAAEHGVDLPASFLVGDGLTDVLAGKTAGCTTILLGHARCDLCRAMAEREAVPDFIVANIVDAVSLIGCLVAKPKEVQGADLFGHGQSRRD
jgi:D-glycero-D-manno-heptose 1,7-bisphosphate phosphatase